MTGNTQSFDPLVTIAIPTFNRLEARLPGIIEAALAQTWRNVEVLVGNNASSDGTKEYLASLTDPRIRVFNHEKNLGANGNFNFLLDNAEGEWFLLFHDDDMIDPDFVESCLGALRPDREYGFIRTGVRAVDSSGRILKERPNQLIGDRKEDLYRSWFRSKTGFYLCNTLYHTSRLREIGGFHSLHNLLEDNYALVNLLDSWDHANIESVKASYRYTYDQRTFQVPVNEWCEDFRGLLDMIVTQCDEKERDDIRQEGQRFFGRLCLRRARAITSPIKRVRARLNVAWHFGLWTLRQPWGLRR